MAVFDVNLVDSVLTTQTMGRKIIYQSVTGTTMDDALAGARQYGYPHGTAYIAELQTKARGSKGRHWDAHNSGNLYVSFIIHKDVKQGEVDSHLKVLEYDLDISGAMATMLTLEEEKVKGISLKWLNDLWIRGHKLCGSLAEYKGLFEVEMEQKHLFILGIGLNMNCDIRRDNGMVGLATSTKCETGRELSREGLFARVCHHLEKILATERDVLLQMYREKQTLQIGQTYRATRLGGTDGGSLNCEFLGLKNDWSIDLRDDSGEILNVFCNQMTIRPHPDRCVYVLTGSLLEEWSSQLLNTTLRALVDTTRYDVRTIEVTHMKEIPHDCALIVIGQLKMSPDPTVTNQIADYVRGGGACMCTGNSCRMFTTSEQFDTSESGQPDIIMLPVDLAVEDIAPVTIPLPCLVDNRDTSPRDAASGKVTVLASHPPDKTGDSAVRVLPANCDGGSPDIIVAELGKGKICLSRPSVELTYADVEMFFPALVTEVENLKRGIFYRDCVILRALQELGL